MMVLLGPFLIGFGGLSCLAAYAMYDADQQLRYVGHHIHPYEGRHR